LTKSFRGLRSPVGIAVVLLAGAASIASYAAVSATVNGEPPTSPYQGFVALLQPGGSSFSEDQVKLMAAATVPGGPGEDPSLAYNLAVCGSQPFSGMLLIGGSARLSHLTGVPALGTHTAGASSGVENLPDVTFLDQGSGAVIDLGPVQAITLTMAAPGKCESPFSTQQPEPLFLGQGQAISGQAAAPVQRQWRLGWWGGPRTSEDWPLIGNLPGIRDQDLGAFQAVDGLHGAWVRPLDQYNTVSVGGLQANASVDEAQPALSSDTDLAWDSAQPLQPNAVVTNTLSMSRWQNWLVWAGIFLGIGGSLLASLLYQWARPSSRDDPPLNAVQPQDPAKQTRVAQKLLTIATVLVILAQAIRSRRHPG
jgi:hypothetical protein